MLNLKKKEWKIKEINLTISAPVERIKAHVVYQAIKKTKNKKAKNWIWSSLDRFKDY